MGENRKKQMEEKIRNKVQGFYSASADEYVPEHSRRNAIIELLYEYTVTNSRYRKYYVGEHGIEEYGIEIFETCVYVLKSYSPEEGDFIHYFNSAIVKTLKRNQGKINYDRSHQVKTISENRIRTIFKYVRDAERYPGSGEISIDRIIELAREDGIALTELEILDYRSAEKSIDEQIGDGPDSIAFGETIRDSRFDPERILIELYEGQGLEKLVRVLDKEFLKAQKRQQGYLSQALTARLSVVIGQIIEANQEARFLFEDTSWFDRETFNTYLKTGEPALQKDIAARNGITKEGLSTAINKLLKQIGEHL